MDDSERESDSQVPEVLPTALQVTYQTPEQPPAEAWTAEKIIAELEREFDGTLPEATIRAAQERRDEIIPHLIKLVERATALVRDGEFPIGNGQLIAVLLLTEFRAKEALPAILDSVSLADKDVDELYGDAITEDFCRVFAVLAEDAPEQIDALIANRSCGEFVRWEAAETYSLWVRDGRLTRNQAVEKLRQHLRNAIANQDHELAGPLVCELESYVPREALEEIHEAFRLGLVDETIIDIDAIDESLTAGDVRWQRAIANLPPTEIGDTVEELLNWVCYQGDEYDEYDEGDQDSEYDVDFAQAFREKMGYPPLLLDDPSLLDDDEFRDVWNAAQSTVLPETHSDTIRRTEPRVGRNEPCPCGSGKKFKKCCGKH